MKGSKTNQGMLFGILARRAGKSVLGRLQSSKSSISSKPAFEDRSYTKAAIRGMRRVSASWIPYDHGAAFGKESVGYHPGDALFSKANKALCF
jgi:hypothetical protein